MRESSLTVVVVVLASLGCAFGLRTPYIESAPTGSLGHSVVVSAPVVGTGRPELFQAPLRRTRHVAEGVAAAVMLPDLAAPPLHPALDAAATPWHPPTEAPVAAAPGADTQPWKPAYAATPSWHPAQTWQPAWDAAVESWHPAAWADKYWAIDVECVATGARHSDRAVAQVSLVRGDGSVELDLYVKPNEPTYSYLTPLTGLTQEIIEEKGVALQVALEILRAHLPKDAIVVGHSVHHDIRWLGLQLGVDFAGVADVADMWRVWHPQYGTWSVFGQEHLAKFLLGEDTHGGAHNAVGDAVKSLKLLRLHQDLMARGAEFVERAKHALLAAPPSMSFARRNPTFDGVCMGNWKTCNCGAPFES